MVGKLVGKLVENTDRLVFLLMVAEKECKHLMDTSNRLSLEAIDQSWVKFLESDTTLSERVDAFVARFGRLQDHLGDKLIPELLKQMLEKPASAIENLSRMEKLGLLESVASWVEARNLRNKLVHEYVVDASEFAATLNRALKLVPILTRAYNNLSGYSQRFLEK